MVSRLVAIVCMRARVCTARRGAGTVQPHGAREESCDDLHRSVRTARAHPRQPRHAAGRAAAFGALQQRLPVQLQPVQHGARQPARQRAVAVARLGVHLPVRHEPRRLPAHDPELRTDPRGPRRNHRRPPRVGGLRVPALHVRHRRGSRPAPGPGGVHARQRGPARRARGRRHDDQRDRGEASARRRRSSRWASPTASTSRWPYRS